MFNWNEEIRNPALKKYIPDYHLYVVDAMHLSREEINEFHTDLRFFFTALQAAVTRDMIIDDTLTARYVETYDALAMLTGDERFRVKEGGISMCALFDMAEERGLKRGIEAFILDNLAEQIPVERILVKLQERFALNVSQAEEYLKNTIQM